MTASSGDEAVELWRAHFADADLEEPEVRIVPQPSSVSAVTPWDEVRSVQVADPPRP